MTEAVMSETVKLLSILFLRFHVVPGPRDGDSNRMAFQSSS